MRRPAVSAQAFRFVLASLCSLSLWLSVPAFSQPRPAFMPLPKSVQVLPGALPLGGPFLVDWENCESAALDAALARLQRDVGRQTGMVFDPRDPVALSLACDEPADLIEPMGGEAYELVVNADGVQVEAQGPAGVLRAFASLRQLVVLKDEGAEILFVQIDDEPRFAWRGIMLDPARHFIEVATVKRQIDAMEQLKLNVLHLHLSDDQGFRVESKRFPKLNSVSAKDGFYTQDEIRELVAYAAARGILIVPEFDMPGHSRAMVEAYPEIGVIKPSIIPGLKDAALNPARPETYQFIEELLAEMAPLFPGEYLHIGGDEVAGQVWDDNRDVQQLMEWENLASKTEVEGYFANRVIAMVRSHGKVAIGWDELLEAGADKSAIVQAWQTSNSTAEAVSRGYRTIVSAGYYLDLLMPAEFHYLIDPLDPSAAGFSPAEAEAIRNANPVLAAFLTDELVAHPLPPLSAEEQDLILGAEAPLWGELVSDEIVDARLWPRAAALAERFWSPAAVRDVDDMYRRLQHVYSRLNINGLMAETNRDRMTRRISPAAVEPVATLLDLVSPVRNMAHDERIPAMLQGKIVQQQLNALADAAPGESLVARKFEADVKRFLRGDESMASALRAQLFIWKNNHERFRYLAESNMMLKEALPTFAFIAELAQAGLDAMEAIGNDRELSAKAIEEAEALLIKAEQQEAASEKPLLSFVSKQPPADLIVAIAPGIKHLVAAAAGETR